MVAGEDHAFVQYRRLTFAGLFHFGIARYAPAAKRRHGQRWYSPGGIPASRSRRKFLRAGDHGYPTLNHNTVCALTLYDWLRDAQLVNTVTQNINVLLNRGVCALRSGTHRSIPREVDCRSVQESPVTMTRRQMSDRLITRFAVTERDAQP